MVLRLTRKKTEKSCILDPDGTVLRTRSVANFWLISMALQHPGQRENAT